MSAPKKVKTKQKIYLTLSEKEIRMLTVMAEVTGNSRSGLVGKLVRNYYKKWVAKHQAKHNGEE